MKHDDPKENILNAATKVFAARGFRDATIRQICAEANVNVSMVNYHFKTKERLYAEVVRRLFSFMLGEDMARIAEGVHDARSWRAAVRRFVERFVGYFSVTKEPGIFAARIFRWEVTRPSSICRELQLTYGRLAYEGFNRLLAMAEDDPVRLRVWSGTIWGQIAVLLLVDDQWLGFFNPPDMSREDWGRRIADNLCESIFKSLTYKDGAARQGAGRRARPVGQLA